MTAPADTPPPDPVLDHGALLRSRTPPGSIYRDPGVLEEELEHLFYRNWICVAREEELPSSGDFLTRSIGREHLLLTRTAAGLVRGFYNLCRHRGTRVVLEPRGTGAHSFLCPYHAWSYDLEGRLIGAPHTKALEAFDRAEHGLHPVRLERWGGFVWANLEPEGPSLAEALGPFFQQFARFPFAELRCGGRQTYEVEANWKILVENFSECYHCAPVHPGLNRLTPYLSGRNDAVFRTGKDPRLFAGGYMEFTKDFTSMTRTGYTRRPVLPGMSEADRRRVYYYVLFPNLFWSIHPDYLMIHRAWPVSPTHSRVENEFYFLPETMAAAGFDPSDAMELWDEINRQDWKVCELAQEGTGSRAWKGGRYSEQELLVHNFDEFVAAELRRSSPGPGGGA